MQKLTYLAWRFSPLVNGYKAIRAYHAGDGVWVEVDVLLDEKTPLEIAHDIAETLQVCLLLQCSSSGLFSGDRSWAYANDP